ncbi:MAG: hypothetical protein RR189_00035, partial [Bacilli bacterium]
ASFVTFGVTYYFMKDRKVASTPVEIPVKKTKIESKKILTNSGDTDKITINKKEYVLKYENNSNGEEILKINDKVVFSTTPMFSINSIYSVGDIIAVINNGGDSAEAGSSLTFIDMAGNVIKKINSWETDILSFSLYTREHDVKFTGDEIIFNGTSVVADYIFFSKRNINDNNSVDNFGVSLPLTNELMNKYNIKNDTVVSGEYRIKYLGDNKFSDMELVSKVTYLEYIKGL